MTNWTEFKHGMASARTVHDVAMQATSGEAYDAGGPDFMAQVYDLHAIA